MKRMKKTLVVVLCMALTLMTFAACGGKDMSSSKFCGTWAAKSVSMSGFEMDASEVYENGFTIDFGKDGTCTVTLDGDSETGKWEETSDGTGAVIDGMDEFKISIDPDNSDILVMDYSGMLMNFEKQK